MDYDKIHTRFIQSWRNRKLREDTLYCRHHIIPIHEDPESTDVVYITYREHAFAHHLRYMFTGTVGNYIAWKALAGLIGIEEKTLLLCSMGGAKGGATTKENSLGIFSPSYDRSAQSRKNHQNGIGLCAIPIPQRLANSAKGGVTTRVNQSGIFREDLQKFRSEWASNAANALTASGNRGGICSVKWREDNPERLLELSSKGGKIGGAIVGSMLWWNDGTTNKKSNDPPGDGWVRGMLMSDKKRNSLFGRGKNE